MKIFIFNFVGFQFDDDDDEYHQNGSMILKAEDKADAIKKFKKFFEVRHPSLSALVERNFNEDGTPNKNVDITEVPEGDDNIAFDLGGY